MVIINPFICPNCKQELQPEVVGVIMENTELIRVCKFCGDKVKIVELK